jgi:aldehyde:ferredoxin oxidoreductase
VEGLLLIGERIYNLERMFNMMKGLSRKDDTLPKRFTEPLLEGGSEGSALTYDDLDRMLDEYYELRGWDKHTGRPKDETLKRLGIEYIAVEQYSN